MESIRPSWRRLLVSAIATFAVVATGSVQRASHAADSLPRPDITGTVLDIAGKPVEGAIVRIWTAGARVGVNPYCPSCYLDCGKTAKSDAAGAFAIKSLDPTLVFRVLFVAKGYEPKFANVDPLKRKPMTVKLKARPSLPNNPREFVSGTVVGPNGKPITDALIEPDGWDDQGEKWFGELEGLDHLAVTDERGRFDVASKKAIDSIDVVVTAHGFAKKRFEKLLTGTSENRLALSEGGAVRGRVTDHGRPVAGVKIGLAQTNRAAPAT